MINGTLLRWIKNAGVLLAVAMVSACGEEYLQSTIDPVTDYGEVSHNLYVQIFWWTMIILVVVWALMAYILIRFREKPGQGKPKQIHGHMGLEIAWTIAPAIIVVAIVIPTIQGVFQVQRPPDGDALVVEVTGKRYWWNFHFPEQGVTTANELHLPVGRPISLRLESGDVIHSFWVPQLGGKRDVNPVVAVPEGQEAKRNWMHFTIKEEGVFWGQCAEFCGEAHSLMGIRVIAETEEEFQAWLTEWQTPAPTANAPETGPAEDALSGGAEPDEADAQEVALTEDPLVARGREVFFRETTCVLCHAIQGTAAPGIIGPNLTRIGSRSTIGAGMLENTPENLARWIKDPIAVKPGVQMPGADYPASYEGITYPATNLNDEQIQALAAYLSSMR
ncbi:MAG: cytochrome c oxidase subunit II [Gemmatimonadetes bacterium]|nr:cytochrome c oxidase subunit II [Gemmatimonadota bacterium]NNM04877.1 cytochrome c oxidase subunit II [Gemmatimonadota bacterium]